MNIMNIIVQMDFKPVFVPLLSLTLSFMTSVVVLPTPGLFLPKYVCMKLNDRIFYPFTSSEKGKATHLALVCPLHNLIFELLHVFLLIIFSLIVIATFTTS